MASEKQEWPTDQEFRRFAANVADAVMWAQSKGRTIAPDDGDGDPHRCCPMGALLSKLDSRGVVFCYPPRFDDQGAAFVAGFDGHDPSAYIQSPYYRLGAA